MCERLRLGSALVGPQGDLVKLSALILRAKAENNQSRQTYQKSKHIKKPLRLFQAAALAAAQEILQAGSGEDELLRMTREAEEQAAKIKEELIQSADSFEENELPTPPLEPEDETPEPVPNPGEELDEEDD